MLDAIMQVMGLVGIGLFIGACGVATLAGLCWVTRRAMEGRP
jgi:hypothetical protein